MIRTFFLRSVVVLAACRFSASTVPVYSQTVPSIHKSRVTDDGAWCWFGDPRAVYFEGEHKRTYVGWISSTGDIHIASIDHDDRAMQDVVLHARLERDDHANPGVHVLPDGRLMVMYTRHSGTAIRVRTSVHPEDIAEWTEERQLFLNGVREDGTAYPRAYYTYPNIVQLKDRDNRLYVHWRGMNWKPSIAWSDDAGATWSNGQILFSAPNSGAGVRPYMKVATDELRQIHYAVTDGHPRNEPTNSIYYFQLRGDSLFTAVGEQIATVDALPVHPTDADCVYDGRVERVRAWIWDIAVDANGWPVIVYARLPQEQRHVYHYARFDGERWLDHQICEAGGWFPETPQGKREGEPHYSGGVVLDHDDPRIVFLSRPVEGVFEIERWVTADEGKTWESTSITRESTANNVRPVVARGHKDDGSVVFWMRNDGGYVHYTNYRASIMMALVGTAETND